MQLLQDVRSLFKRRRRPVEIDLSGTQAERLALTMPCSMAADDDLADVHPVAAADDSPDSSAEVMSLVRKIGDHLEGRAAQSDRLLALADRLPQALESLPEISRQSAGLLEALHDQLAQSRRRDETLAAAMTRLGEASDRQTEMLGLVQQQIEISRQTSEQLVEPLSGLRTALHGLAESGARNAEALVKLDATMTQRDAELTRALTRTQRWLIGAVICCAAASAAAVLTLLR